MSEGENFRPPQSAGINMQSPQSDLTPWTLTLYMIQLNFFFNHVFLQTNENVKQICFVFIHTYQKVKLAITGP